MKQPVRIAFYGKGGIGKSTIACNFSALFGKQGKRVLHIGCDPKADSTRLLTSERIPTVLRQLEHKSKLEREDMLFTGIHGIQCVEAGGPEAGSGCAGLGITTAMEELRQAGVFGEPWDVIVYDVLGDVVCGGFSVPMRRHFADQVFVVTSADYMALYAANNILKGIERYSKGSDTLFGGLILNHVRKEQDLIIGNAFLEQTNTQMLLYLKEEPLMQRADFKRKPLTELFPHTENGKRMQEAAKRILRKQKPNPPVPMSREEMEDFGKRMGEILYGA